MQFTRASNGVLRIRQECGGPRPCQMCERASNNRTIAGATGKMDIAAFGRRSATADGVTKWPAYPTAWHSGHFKGSSSAGNLFFGAPC